MYFGLKHDVQGSKIKQKKLDGQISTRSTIRDPSQTSSGKKIRPNTNKNQLECVAHNIKNPQNNKVFCKKLIVFEGFRPNGYQIRNQRAILHRIACLKIDFRYFLKKCQVFRSRTLKIYILAQYPPNLIENSNSV